MEEDRKRDLQEGQGIDGRTILDWILGKWVPIGGIGLIQLRIVIIGEPF